MTHSTKTNVTFGDSYYDEMVAKHEGCHSVAVAEIDRSMKCFNQPPPKRPNIYEISHSKNCILITQLINYKLKTRIRN